MRKNSFYIPAKLALIELKHGWKHFGIFLSCLILGVAVMATINIFSSIVKSSMNEQAQALLGGDIEIRLRGMPATEKQKKFLKDNYGELSYISTLRTMMYKGDSNLLVEVKAVDEKYPLIGDIVLNEDISKQEAIKNNGVIVDPILLDQMSLQIGDKIEIGKAEYIITATLKNEPDRVLQIFSFGPRVMMSHGSLKKSGLVNTFSLVEHKYRINTKSNTKIDEEFEDVIEDTLQKKFPDYGWRVRTGDDGSNGVNRFLDHLMTFLTLSGLSTFLIAGIGIAGATRFYMEKKYNSIAVMKIMGATKNIILTKFSILLSSLSVFGGAIGVVIATIAINSLLPIASEFLPSLQDSSAFNLNGALLAIFYGVIISFIFSIPVLISALDIKPSALFRSKLAKLDISANKTAVAIVSVLTLILLGILILNADDKEFITGSMMVVVLAFSLLGLISFAVKEISKKIKVKKPWLKLAISNINRRGSTSGTVIFAIGVSLTIFITLNLTEINFEKRLNKIIYEKAPSLFMVDIQRSQKESFKELLLKYSGEDNIMMLPMMRGRLTKIAGTPVEEAEIDDDIDWVTRSDRGLTYSGKEPENANIVEGKWWDEEHKGKALISVDERMLNGMDIDIGDSLTINILGKEIEAEIANARRIDYATFQINFAMMLSPGVIDDFPHSTIATIYLTKPDQEAALVKEIAKDFPGITMIRTKEVLETIREALKNILIALNITVIITLIAGLLVLTSALNSTVRQRIYDIAMLKVLGARKADILKICLTEWIILAMATSVVAVSVGTFSAWLINKKFRATEFYPMPEISILTTVISILIVCLVGYVTNRSLFKIRPANLLRNE